MRILFFGDITGKAGRKAVTSALPRLQEEHQPDFAVANIENAAHGKGLTEKIFNSLLEAGIDFFTSGNHIFSKLDAETVLSSSPDKIIRPANFPKELAGVGFCKREVNNTPVLFLNLNGRVFMENQFDQGTISNPFRKLDELLANDAEGIKVRFLDFHAEATSEKRAMGFHADGRVSVVVGTHTHVQTADAQVLPQGTGYISDVGMVGAKDSVIGAEREGIVQRFLAEDEEEGGSIRVADTGGYEIGYCVVEIDEQTGRCQNIVSRLEYVNA